MEWGHGCHFTADSNGNQDYWANIGLNLVLFKLVVGLYFARIELVLGSYWAALGSHWPTAVQLWITLSLISPFILGHE